MPTLNEYITHLRSLPASEWDTYLSANSGLPGPRGNLTLADAVAEVGDETIFRHLLTYAPTIAPTNTPGEFLAFCGTVGFGKLLIEGHQPDALSILRASANDPRWRVREGTAIALQHFGDHDMVALIDYMMDWHRGTLYEQRAVAAALCEPRLLKNPEHVARVLNILDAITAGILTVTNRKADDFIALRKGLAYCWSVAVVALPEHGKLLMEKWLASSDKDIRWLMRENLKKDRLKRMDTAWVEKLTIQSK